MYLFGFRFRIIIVVFAYKMLLFVQKTSLFLVISLIIV